MTAALTTILFWAALAAALIAQGMILASTRRVLRAAPPRSLLLEWAFALAPALALAFVLFLSWRRT